MELVIQKRILQIGRIDMCLHFGILEQVVVDVMVVDTI
jgi:hypothetical protein